MNYVISHKKFAWPKVYLDRERRAWTTELAFAARLSKRTAERIAREYRESLPAAENLPPLYSTYAVELCEKN